MDRWIMMDPMDRETDERMNGRSGGISLPKHQTGAWDMLQTRTACFPAL